MSEPRRAPRAPRRRGSSDARVVWPPSDRQSARSAISQLMRDRGLGRAFPRNVQREARHAAGSVDGSRRSAGRRDLRDLPTFTIDPIRTPKETTDTLPDGSTIKGIYELSGDTLKSCVAPVGKDRPTGTRSATRTRLIRRLPHSESPSSLTGFGNGEKQP